MRRPWLWSRPEPKPPLMQDLTLRRLRRVVDQARKKAEYEADRMRRKLRSQWDDRLSRPTTRERLAVEAFIAGGVVSTTSLFVLARVSVRYFRRVPNADWITPNMLGGRRWMKGYVTKVRDNDNFRFFHTPGFGWKWLRTIPQKSADLKNETIHIRIAGIDAPELGHFGRESQPGAGESLAWLSKRIEGKFVHCQLLRRDQYDRMVAAVLLKPRFLPGFLFTGGPLSIHCSLSLMMLRAGMATVYEQTGAVYGDHVLARYKAPEEEAQRHERGIWKDGTDIETPAEYKRRIRAARAVRPGSKEPVLPIASPIEQGAVITKMSAAEYKEATQNPGCTGRRGWDRAQHCIVCIEHSTICRFIGTGSE